MIVPRILSHLKHSQNRLAWLLLATFLVLSNLFLASCTSSFGGSSSSSTATATPSELAIAQLRWCGKPSMLFRDEGAVTPTTTASSTPRVPPRLPQLQLPQESRLQQQWGVLQLPQ